MNIAVLEDNPAIFDYMSIALQMAGHHVDGYGKGIVLLDALLTKEGVRDPLRYDVLTVDLLLPGEMSGFEVITRVREVIAPQQLPIVVISGAGTDLLEQVKQTCPDITILIKPFKLKKLLAALERSQGEDSLSSAEMVSHNQ